MVGILALVYDHWWSKATLKVTPMMVLRSNDQRQNISRDAKTRFSHTAMQQHSRSSSFFQNFPFISTFDVISIIITINHDQIVAALEFSVPNVPSLISEDLGAPLFLGGYKVPTSSDHSFHQNHTYIAFYATLFHSKIFWLWNPVSSLKTSSKKWMKKMQTPPNCNSQRQLWIFPGYGSQR